MSEEELQPAQEPQETEFVAPEDQPILNVPEEVTTDMPQAVEPIADEDIDRLDTTDPEQDKALQSEAPEILLDDPVDPLALDDASLPFQDEETLTPNLPPSPVTDGEDDEFPVLPEMPGDEYIPEQPNYPSHQTGEDEFYTRIFPAEATGFSEGVGFTWKEKALLSASFVDFASGRIGTSAVSASFCKGFNEKQFVCVENQDLTHSRYMRMSNGLYQGYLTLNGGSTSSSNGTVIPTAAYNVFLDQAKTIKLGTSQVPWRFGKIDIGTTATAGIYSLVSNTAALLIAFEILGQSNCT